jgi:hypothetical protein
MVKIDGYETLVIRQMKQLLSTHLDQRFPVLPLNICGFLLDPSQLKIDITSYLVQNSTTRESLLKNMIEKFGIKSTVRSDDPGVVLISSTSPCSIVSITSPTASPSLKRRLPVESSSASEDRQGTKKIRENLIQKHSTAPKTAADSIIIEIENYLKLDVDCDDVLRFWQTSCDKFPHLAGLARIVLAVPSTSTPSEQVFSTTGLIVNAKRTALAPENIGKIQMIHDNYGLFKC